MKFDPHPYQKYAIEKIIEEPAVALFLDMGMGKTVSTLTAIQTLIHDRFEVSRVLIIAPLQVARSTWSAEIEKWDHLKGLKISKVIGSVEDRRRALMQDTDLFIINRENVEWLVGHLGTRWPFDMIVIDELSSFKSPKAHRFRALRKVRPYARRVVGLTGTPAPNGLIDLWAQVYLLDQGERLGETSTAYKDRYFIPGRRNGHIVFDWKLKPEAERAIHDKLSDLCVSMKSEDWLSLPDRFDNKIEVDLEPAERRRYEEMERDRLLTFTEGDVTAETAAVLSGKLLQLANGAVYDENGSVQILHDAKLEALEQILESANGKPVLVFYAFRHDQARIMDRFAPIRPRVMKTEQDLIDWNRGNVPLMLAHPASAGHGLNLQAGGNVIVWFGLTWSLELYQQANARIHRQGQKESVIVHHILTKGTIDADVLRALTNKTNRQDALLDAVKARIETMKGVAITR
jgi:SNF2 family DNA or RNA helicase